MTFKNAKRAAKANVKRKLEGIADEYEVQCSVDEDDNCILRVVCSTSVTEKLLNAMKKAAVFVSCRSFGEERLEVGR